MHYYLAAQDCQDANVEEIEIKLCTKVSANQFAKMNDYRIHQVFSF